METEEPRDIIKEATIECDSSAKGPCGGTVGRLQHSCQVPVPGSTYSCVDNSTWPVTRSGWYAKTDIWNQDPPRLLPTRTLRGWEYTVGVEREQDLKRILCSVINICHHHLTNWTLIHPTPSQRLAFNKCKQLGVKGRGCARHDLVLPFLIFVLFNISNTW
jgi:hypothetical protein